MNIITKKSALNLAIVSVLTLTGASPALAGTVGGSVVAINTLTQTDSAAITIGSSTAGAANDQTGTTIVSGQIDNNSESGWKLTVASGNIGKLVRGTGGAGQEILYTNVSFATTGGTLGAGLTAPAQTKNIVTGADGGDSTGTTYFATRLSAGASAVGEASTASVAYGYTLKISWASDLALLSGSYADTITLTLANDS
jgi:hypothetical protein